MHCLDGKIYNAKAQPISQSRSRNWDSTIPRCSQKNKLLNQCLYFQGTVVIQLTKFKHKLDHNHKQMTEQFLLDVPVLSYRAVMVALVNTAFVFLH